MADRAFFHNLGSPNNELIIIAGRFAVGATGAVGTIDAPGVRSIVRDSQGVYTVTLDDAYLKVLHGNAAVRKTANNVDLYPQNELLGGTDNKTFQFRFLTGTTETDPANGDDVSFVLFCRNRVQK